MNNIKLIYIFLLNIICVTNSFSQLPEILIEHSYGGLRDENVDNLQKTLDGGYIVGGNTYSNDGDITDHHGTTGYADVWIFKLDSALNIIWAKSYGGLLHDRLFFIEETPTGDFMVGATTNSTNGDVSESFGDYDFWIFKIDANGNLLWEKSYGGSEWDYLLHLRLTSDGGCIAVGSTRSTDGDVAEHDPTHGKDSWVIKLDADGNIEWQRCLGGTGDDELRDVIITEDEGYLFTGQTWSNDFDVLGNHGGGDIWIIKLNVYGENVWQKCLGGTDWDNSDCTIETSDGGVIMCGDSRSENGDVSNHYGTAERYDAWVVKMDGIGNIEWEKNYGGKSYDYGANIFQLADGSYTFGASTSSTGSDVSFNHGDLDAWVVHIDAIGNIIWEKTYGGSKDDYTSKLYRQNDGSYILLGQSWSEDGDVSFNNGHNDTWIALLSSGCIEFAEICNSLDDNCNGIIDDGITESISISAGGATTFCQGGSTTLTAIYSGTSVQWKKNGSNIPGATSSTYSVNKSGNYSAVTTSPCGTATSSIINVTVNKNPNASISAGGGTTFCAGGSVTLTEIPVAGCTYQWYKGASLIVGATTTNYIATTAGNYKCRVTKTATGCYKNSNVISVTVPCKEGEEIINEEDIFSIYPNPNNGTFTISVFSASLQALRETENTKLEICNSIGQLIYSQQINSSDNNFTQTISIDNISSGIYFVRVGDGNNYAEQKIIIE